MNPMLVSLVGVSLIGLTTMIVTLVKAGRSGPDVGDFLEGLGYTDYVSFEEKLAEPVVRRLANEIVHGVIARVERVLPSQYVGNIRVQLAHAGIRSKFGAGRLVITKLALGIGGLALVPLVPVGSPLMGVLTLILLPTMGYMVPSVRLKRKIQTRSDAIFKDLPDIVDMLAIAVEAGSGFESALSLICLNFKSPLTDELSMALRDMELGLPRKQALQALRDRVDVDAVRTLILVLLQADALGIPIGRVLKSQATEVRARRRAWAREKAAKLPVKIMFPLVLFIFPPIMALVLGPAAGSFSQLGN